MKVRNCSPLLALVAAGGMAVGAPAIAGTPSADMSSSAIETSHNVLESSDMQGDRSQLAQSQQQQQQQQQHLASNGMSFDQTHSDFEV